MTEFYYQIKGKKAEGQECLSHWVFPPIFSGKVVAENKKQAKEIINENYGKQFPSRVLKTDIQNNEFLLSIEEIKPGSHLEKLFELRKCLLCKNTFYIIDKYNDNNHKNKSWDYCSDVCKDEHNKFMYMKRNENDSINAGHSAVIYKITNKNNGMVYIGKTNQVFTLRWYQHFFQLGGTKFHEAIKNSIVTDWTFEIQEIITLPIHIVENKEPISYMDEREKYILERERFWIDHYDSIKNGYNSI